MEPTMHVRQELLFIRGVRSSIVAPFNTQLPWVGLGEAIVLDASRLGLGLVPKVAGVGLVQAATHPTRHRWCLRWWRWFGWEQVQHQQSNERK